MKIRAKNGGQTVDITLPAKARALSSSWRAAVSF